MSNTKKESNKTTNNDNSEDLAIKEYNAMVKRLMQNSVIDPNGREFEP